MFSTLPIEIQKHILSHVYRHDAIYASMVCTSWSVMCAELYKDYIPGNNLTPNNVPILNNNSHALKFYLRYNILIISHIKNITNRNCLNILCLIGLTQKNNFDICFDYGDANILLTQFVKTNNVSRPYIVKKLVHYVIGGTVFDRKKICDSFMGGCIKNKSYDFAKYLLGYCDSNNIPIESVLNYCGNNIGNVFEYLQFLINIQ